jgi:uncharacterized membrane protein (UPF0127 family)
MHLLKRRELYFGILLLVAVLLLLGFYRYTRQMTIAPDTSFNFSITKNIQIGNATIIADVAATPAAREAGLSYRASLPDGRGMLFVFDTPGDYAFWMKDMSFSIDMFWLKKDGTIITIAQNVSPSTYPQAFYPATPDASYVLELPAGFSASHGIVVGMQAAI